MMMKSAHPTRVRKCLPKKCTPLGPEIASLKGAPVHFWGVTVLPERNKYMGRLFWPERIYTSGERTRKQKNFDHNVRKGDHANTAFTQINHMQRRWHPSINTMIGRGGTSSPAGQRHNNNAYTGKGAYSTDGFGDQGWGLGEQVILTWQPPPLRSGSCLSNGRASCNRTVQKHWTGQAV